MKTKGTRRWFDSRSMELIAHLMAILGCHSCGIVCHELKLTGTLRVQYP